MNDMTTNPATVPVPPIAATPKIDAAIDQDNPLLKAKVAAFVEAAGGEAAGTQKPKIEIQPNADFDGPSPNDTMLTEALVDTQKIDVTDEEKALFVKAILNDQPIKLTVVLMDGNFKVQLRSRTFHEQRRILDVLTADITDGTIPKDDLAYYVTRMHQYAMAIMIERVNGEVFSEISIPSESTVASAQKILHDAIAPKIEKLNSIKWTALQNALRIFEAKCAKLGTEAANQDFWKPRG